MTIQRTTLQPVAPPEPDTSAGIVRRVVTEQTMVMPTAEEFPFPRRGRPDAPIMVICDSPTIDAMKQGLPMTHKQLTWFAKQAAAQGFVEDDFQFVALCPPIKLVDQGSAKRKWDHVKQYEEKLREIVESANPRAVVTCGELASRVMLKRAVKVTKARGITTHAPDNPDRIVFPVLSPKLCMLQPDYMPIFDADLGTLHRLKVGDYDPVSLQVTDVDYQWCTDLTHLINNKPKAMAVDTEGSGLKYRDPGFEVYTVQISTGPGMALVLPVSWTYYQRHREAFVAAGIQLNERDIERLTAQVKMLMEDASILKMGHNFKFDMGSMEYGLGINVQGWDQDTELMTRAVNENMMSYSLDDCARVYVPEMAGYADLFNQMVDKSRMIDVPPFDELDAEGTIVRPGMLSYAGGDPDATYRIARAVYPMLKRDPGQMFLYKHVQMRGLMSFAKRIESYGQCIDRAALDAYKEEVDTWVKAEGRALFRLIPAAVRRKYLLDPKGASFTRDVFVQDILFSADGFNLTPKVYTKSTSALPAEMRIPSVSTKDHLPYFTDRTDAAGDFVRRFIDFKKAQKLLSTYIDGFYKYLRAANDNTDEEKIYPSYNFRTNTSRTNCVHADTPVLTRAGIKPMHRVAVGDEVWTHVGRWRKVTATYTKHPDRMYRLRLSNGQKLLCTLGHMVMTVYGWRSVYDVILESHSRATRNCSGGDAALSGDQSHTATDSGLHAVQHVQCPRDHKAQYDTGGAQGVEADPATRQQARQAQPDVRKEASELHRRVCGWLRILNDRGGWSPLPGASRSHGADDRYSPVASTFGIADPSYRRGQDQQLTGQPSSGNEIRSRGIARIDELDIGIEGIDCVGVYDVYDLTVEDDCSYTACGVINHNSQDPNGQNFPKRGNFAAGFLRLIKASAGKVLIACDMSQVELRLTAWSAMEREMLRIYNTGGDIHEATAAATLRMTIEEFRALPSAERKLQRFRAKAVNFGFIYGAQWKTFQTYAKTNYGADYTDKQAQETRELYFEKYQLLPWHARVEDFIKENGFVKTLHGGTRHLPAVWSTDWKIATGAIRQAINAPIQRMGSDLGVIAIARLAAQVDPRLMRPVGFVHDQIVCEVDPGYVQQGMGWLAWVMENPPLNEWFGITAPLPFIADPEFGMNLYETTEVRRDHGAQTYHIDGGDRDGEVLENVRNEMPEWWNVNEDEAYENFMRGAVPSWLPAPVSPRARTRMIVG